MDKLALRLDHPLRSFALRVELEVGRETLALVGPSGAGKSSVLRAIAGLLRPETGRIALGSEVWLDTESRISLPPERRSVGLVFQEYALFPHLTVAENVTFGVRRRERGRRLAELLRLVGLDGLEARYPHELSGGQQQRVALARALAPQPALVLLDEPWSNIDPLLRTAMRDDLAAILRQVGVTVVLVTHDREEAFSLADRIALMRHGTIVQSGSPEALYLQPTDRWAAEFVGAGNFMRGRVEGDLVDTLLGRFPVTGSYGSADVDVLIRPELLGLRPDPRGSGEIVAREFRGHDVVYRVALADGTVLVSQRPSNEAVALGTRVALEPHLQVVPVFS